MGLACAFSLDSLTILSGEDVLLVCVWAAVGGSLVGLCGPPGNWGEAWVLRSACFWGDGGVYTRLGMLGDVPEAVVEGD